MSARASCPTAGSGSMRARCRHLRRAKFIAHIYRYTTQVSARPPPKIEGAGAKVENRKQINPPSCLSPTSACCPAPRRPSARDVCLPLELSAARAARSSRAQVQVPVGLLAAQNFQYKTGNFLDQALECFGSVSVLPSAFSA